MPNIPFANEDEWHALRAQHVGGSEIAALFYYWQTPDRTLVMRHMFERVPDDFICMGCVSPYTTGYALWMEKAGRLQPSFEENERIKAGQHVEAGIAAWAADKWPDLKLRKVRRYIASDTVPGWGASLDYELQKGGVPVEVKNVDGLVFRDQWQGDDDELNPPLHIVLQVQSQIGVAKATHGFIVAMVGGNVLHRVQVDRHEPTQAMIAEAVEIFWKSVLTGAEPTWMADYETAKRLYLNEVTEPKVLDDDPDADREARAIQRWSRHAKFVEGHLDRLKGRFAVMMDGASRGSTASFKVSWPLVTSEEKQVSYLKKAATYRGGMRLTKRKD